MLCDTCNSVFKRSEWFGSHRTSPDGFRRGAAQECRIYVGAYGTFCKEKQNIQSVQKLKFLYRIYSDDDSKRPDVTSEDTYRPTSHESYLLIID